LVRGGLRTTAERILDDSVLLEVGESARPSTLSDHAGVLATVTPSGAPLAR
jgi:hypothetical protein